MNMLIAGAWVGSSDGSVCNIHNPATGELVGVVPQATLADAERAVLAAQSGKQAIRATPVHQRAAILDKVARRIEENADELAVLLCHENGKRISETVWEINATARIFRGYGEEAKRNFGVAQRLDAVPGSEHSLAITIRQPIGVVVAIVPFNYPVELWAHKAAAGLASGNAVITKTPEDCPLVILQIARYLEDAGLPKNVHQVVTGGREVGEALVSSPGTDVIAMTGSTSAGRRILEVAAPLFKHILLELGGNDATIICDDADVDTTAEALINGRFKAGNGQTCCAVKRALVARPLYNRLLDAVVERTKTLKVGDPLDPTTDVGPLINKRGVDQVADQVRRAVAEGAKIAVGGSSQGNFFEPAVLTDVEPGTETFHDEIFGPVLPLIPFDDFEDALRLANDSQYGLQAAVFTSDIKKLMRAYEVLDVGTVIANHTTAIRVETVPFGGDRQTGNGREGIHHTMLKMTKEKSLLLPDVFP